MAAGWVRRAYRDDDDYRRMRRFLQAGWTSAGETTGLFHVGDLTWQRFMYTREVMPPEERIALWEWPDGDLAGFAWIYPKSREISLQIDPGLAAGDLRGLVDEMLAWGAERLAAEPGMTAEGPAISAHETDRGLVALLTERGFAVTDDSPMRFHRRPLAGELPEIRLPDGFSVRPVREDELADRVEIHREVWAPSRFTLEGYRQLRASPGYDPELDIVAVAPDGTLAAYAICWQDEVNRSGEFEPVGAREAFRGQGLTKAVLLEAMRRLRARGCETVYVFTTEDRPPAVALYRSVGFELVDRWHTYRRGSA